MFSVKVVDCHYEGKPELAASYIISTPVTTAIVETGTAVNTDIILAALDEAGIQKDAVSLIAVTHVHLDHAGAAGALARQLPNAKVLCHPHGTRHLADPTALIKGATAVHGEERMRLFYGTTLPVPKEQLVATENGHCYPLGPSVSLQVHHSPGHAPHHQFLSLHAPLPGGDTPVCVGVFTGDGFAASYSFMRRPESARCPWPNVPAGRPTASLMVHAIPPQFDPVAWHGSLDLLAGLQPHLIFFTHYGPAPFTHEMIQAAHRMVRTHVFRCPIAFILLRARAQDDYVALVAAPSAAELPSIASLTTEVTALVRAQQQIAATVPDDFSDRLQVDANLCAHGITMWRQKQLSPPKKQ
ncbi:putative MBL fold metallo-hydrolase [Paratrimastix pyriformis]|uniref:MBL fold metallo-hydrolase n=1 Tax=Paratrimastix pyriformis TaxID=342808 RepID=A0ABQ8UQC6_9EUKA|nr:putative MBL fold metallo-hydrolase [Paratrimastix pyriformis]